MSAEKHETHSEIIAEARDRYTVHDCNECNWRKSCDLNSHGFDSDECEEKRHSIALMFGIEDEYFAKLLCRLEEAYKREVEDAERRGHHAATKACCETIEKAGPFYDAESVGNSVRLRAALKSLMDNLRIHAEMPCEQITMNRAEVWAMIEGCRAALAAPARNCDLYVNLHDAVMAWMNECYDVKHIRDITNLANWLYSSQQQPAKRKKVSK